MCCIRFQLVVYEKQVDIALDDAVIRFNIIRYGSCDFVPADCYPVALGCKFQICGSSDQCFASICFAPFSGRLPVSCPDPVKMHRIRLKPGPEILVLNSGIYYIAVEHQLISCSARDRIPADIYPVALLNGRNA
jgi:hypothetical protein